MFKNIRRDIRAVKEHDPAANSSFGIFINYPGVQAANAHRFENLLWRHGLKGIARWLSQRTRHHTGIEIHPAAKLGHGVFIDHGMGVIIGETAVVGDDVVLYQGVTLGGTGKQSGKRHPNIGDGCIIGVGACVLGNITLGDQVKVGGGAVVLDDVPSNSTVVGIPGRVVTKDGIRICPADPARRELMPDPIEDQIAALQEQVQDLQNTVQKLAHHA
ncbi:MAG: serine O-acetyltransferase [Coriobacteriales bacterium]|jgi:serine O-acetyltransferase|nr:serine O-acetyltransferase [Coriobacteriales bacterium]